MLIFLGYKGMVFLIVMFIYEIFGNLKYNWINRIKVCVCILILIFLNFFGSCKILKIKLVNVL